MPKETIFLIDGTSMCYRSFFAIKLSTSKGFPCGAVFGVYRTLKKIISKFNPQYLCVCFDVSRKTFRTEKYQEYKINRPPLPDPLKAQLPLIKDLIAAMGIEQIGKEGFEADDIIASLCNKALADDFSVVIVSADKDLYQLIRGDDVFIYNYNKDLTIGNNEFLKDFGFLPQQITDYLALSGDSSDNIPGAKGIGKVGARKLIEEFKDIDNIFSNLDRVKPKIRDILQSSKEMIYLSKELAQLVDCQITNKWEDLKIRSADNETLYRIFTDLEFKALIKDIALNDKNKELPLDFDIPDGFVEKFKEEPLAFNIQGNDIFIFDPVNKRTHKTAKSKAAYLLCDSKIKKITYGCKDQKVTNQELEFNNLYFDVKVAAYILDSSLIDFSLVTLVGTYLKEHLSQISEESKPYYIYQLYKILEPKLITQGQEKLFFDIEMPLIDILSQMQTSGVKINLKELENLLKEVDKKSLQAMSKVYKLAGREFNLNSPKQLREVLFEEMKIKPIKKTKTGYSTNEEVLERLALKYPIAGVILDYRHMAKLKTTYITPLVEEVKKNKGMLHAEFHQTSTQTGRLSSSSPNLQSIPARGQFSDKLRRSFIPSFNNGFLLSGDYSQIELRILAHLSGDENLIMAFNDDRDIHSFTAGLLFSKDPDKVDFQERDMAKRVNFGIIYGMSSFGLAKELKISPTQAQNFIDDYFQRYEGVRRYIDGVKESVEKKGYVETILKRRRYLPEAKSSNLHLREFAYRQAVNAPIQGSCADLIKIAMVRIDKELKAQYLRTKLVLQIHDELVFDVCSDELDKVKVFICKYMEEAIKLEVPVKVNLKSGNNLADLKELK
ncbi:MAG: DNA polymerase I [Candidatus Omnitrophica bacterium]|nr:DNA polymerase I [Candidatus Omnitrophota bacterium]